MNEKVKEIKERYYNLSMWSGASTVGVLLAEIERLEEWKIVHVSLLNGAHAEINEQKKRIAELETYNDFLVSALNVAAEDRKYFEALSRKEPTK